MKAYDFSTWTDQDLENEMALYLTIPEEHWDDEKDFYALLEQEVARRTA